VYWALFSQRTIDQTRSAKSADNMSSHGLLTALLFGLGCATAQACVCGDKLSEEHAAQWIEERAAAASYVFLARITEVTASEQIPALDTTVKIQILERLKGAASFSSPRISECQNFELTPDARAFCS
jgi:hypothetical protein